MYKQRWRSRKTPEVFRTCIYFSLQTSKREDRHHRSLLNMNEMLYDKLFFFHKIRISCSFCSCSVMYDVVVVCLFVCLFVRFDRSIDRSVVIFLPPPILASTNTFNCWILYSNVSVLIQVCVCR